MTHRRFGRVLGAVLAAGVVAAVMVASPPDQPDPSSSSAEDDTTVAAGSTAEPSAPADDHAPAVEADLASLEGLGEEGQTPPPRTPEGHRNGQMAVDHLGDRLAEVAATHGMTEDQLRATLLSDRSLWLDPEDRLYYVEPAVGDDEHGHDDGHEDEAPSAPPAAAGPASADENRHPDALDSITVESTGVSAAGAGAASSPFPLAETFLLHSKPGSDRVIYLDFDGDSVTNTAWHGYVGMDPSEPLVSTPFDLDGSPGTFSAAEQELIQGAWQRVAEDFAAFDVDVTTEYPGEAAIHDSSDGKYGSHVVIAGTNPIAPGCGCGGIAYLSMFNYAGTSHAYLQPAFAFQQGGIDTVKEVAEVISHEVGHNLGLVHDGTTTSGYYYGHGAWAPIMGVGYNRPVVHWSNADYPNAVNQTAEKQDDYAVMASFGLPTRADEVGDVRDGTATALTPGVPFPSVITTPADKDVFSFTAPGGLATLQVDNAPASPNLDVQLQIHNAASGTLVHTEDPMVAMTNADVATGLDAVAVVADLPAGDYFATVDGVGADPDGDPGTYDGYTDYGSIGDYVITVGFGVCGIDDDLDDDDASTEVMRFPTEGTSGKRCANDDDWIRLPGVAGTTLSATLTVQDDDLTLELVGPNGTTVLDDAVATSTTPGTASFLLTANGDHYLRITGDPSAESRYSLATELSACPPDDQYDITGDNTVSTTVSMTVPGSKHALMCSTDASRSDYTQLPLTVGHRVEITVDFAVGGSNNLELYLYKDGGSSLPVSWRTNPDGSKTISYVPLQTGNHQIRVYRVNGTVIPYDLSVVQYDEPAPTISHLYFDTGAVGDDVTIVGSGFAGVTSVTFADGDSGVPATFVVQADTTITTAVPPGAITGPITVTNGAGSAQRTFTVLEGGRITGNLTGPPNTYLYDCVTVWSSTSETEVSNIYKQLDQDGSLPYESAFLEPGTYRISAGGCDDTIRTFYDGGVGAATWAEASDVTIVSGSNTTGIDLQFKPSTGSITGTVTGTDGVEDVCVSAINALSGHVVMNGYTNASGAFTISGLAAGTYYVGFGCGSGYGDFAYMIEYWTSDGQGSFAYADAEYVFVNAGGATVANTALDAAAMISGHLTSSVDGSDAAGACIEAVEYDNSGPFGAWVYDASGWDGTFAIPARVEGSWWLTFGGCRPDGWRTLELEEPIVVTAGANVDASRELDPAPTGAIEGIVTDESAAPIQWICVGTLHGEEWLFDQTLSTGAYGLYELDPGTYQVIAQPCAYPLPNLLDAALTVVVGTDDSPTGDVETGQDITMLAGGAIEGYVTSTEAGSPPVSGVCVSAYNLPGEEDPSIWVSTSTTSTGFYRIERLPSGTYDVAFSGCDYDTVSWARGTVEDVVVTRPQTTDDVNIALDPGASLSGTITESDGITPIYGLCVDLQQGDTHITSTDSGFDGSYLFDDLSAGTYDLVVGGCGQELYLQETVSDIVIGAAADVVQDVAVLKAGLITGTVTGADYVTVTAVDAATEAYVNSTSPDVSTGVYQLFVPPGDVKVSFYDQSSGTTVWYDAATTVEGAQVINVAEGATVPGIDATFETVSTPPEIYWFDPMSGPPGTEVTIYGAGFTGTTEVTFNGQVADFVEVSDNELTATVPENATTGSITVARDEQVAYSWDPFEVTPALTRFEQDTSVFSFSPGWSQWTHAAHSGGSAHYTSTDGRSATVVITGTTARVIGQRGPNRAIAEIWIDGTLVETVDTYSPTWTNQATLTTITGLAPGNHTITITKAGQNPSADPTSSLVLDAIDAEAAE